MLKNGKNGIAVLFLVFSALTRTQPTRSLASSRLRVNERGKGSYALGVERAESRFKNLREQV